MLISVQRSTVRYCGVTKDDEQIRKRLRELAAIRRRYGLPRLHEMVKREGLVINHKRTERIYREEGLQLKKRTKKKRASQIRVELPRATRSNERWTMDFMSDSLWNGRRFRVLTVLDQYSRECPALEVDTSIGGLRVTHVLDRLGELRGLPKAITIDNGPEFMSRAMDAWAYRNKVQLQFIRPGKPMDNAYIESFNGKLRDECLNEHWFLTLGHARSVIESWRYEYNHRRPHSSLGNLTPAEFARSAQGLPPGEEQTVPLPGLFSNS